MGRYKIFISGVQKELKTERRAIKNYILSDVLLAEYFEVFLFEDFPAKSKSAENAYLDEVGGGDIYIGVFGRQYGGQDGASPTESEFREAKRKNKHILIYIKGNSYCNPCINCNIWNFFIKPRAFFSVA